MEGVHLFACLSTQWCPSCSFWTEEPIWVLLTITGSTKRGLRTGFCACLFVRMDFWELVGVVFLELKALSPAAALCF